MKQFLKTYQVVMHADGPVFIGNGREIGKKEYLFLDQKKAGIPDIQKFYQELCRRDKSQQFEQYLLENSGDDLTGWLKKQDIKTEEIRPFLKYTLDCGDAVIENGVKLQLLECMKDAYGKPYVPGSSLKGMFRTILLGADLIRHPAKYRTQKNNLKENVPVKAGRNSYLKRDAAQIEGRAFRTLNRENSRPNDAVNDCLQGLVISDSSPLETDSLVLCQKVELHTNGMEKTLPILLECIRPGSEIRFTITIDTSICQVTVPTLMQAVETFIHSYESNFADAFPGIDKPEENSVLLGGGCGFVSKTILYPMYGKQEGLPIVQNIFDITLGRLAKTHKHDSDHDYGASPHILKCTKYRGKTVKMGLCRIKDITPA